MSQVTFQYLAVDANGARTRGELRAANRKEAYRQVVASGLRPLRLKSDARRWHRAKRVGLRDLSHFTLQFATLMHARIPIADGLRSIADQEPNETFRAVICDIADHIEGGMSVTDAIAPHRRIFGSVYVETLHAAEKTGNIIAVLNDLAEMLDQQYETAKNVKGALMYPLCVVGAMVLAVVFLTVAVVPKFADMFERRGVDLPLATKALITISQSLTDQWYVWIPGVMAVVWGSRRLWRRPAAQARIDAGLHRIPKLRDILVGLAVSRFTNVFGLCLQSGMCLVDAIQLAGRVSGRPMLQADAEKMRIKVNSGGRLTDVLDDCRYLPGFARRMIVAGEETAEMTRMCQLISKHYSREVQHLTRNVSTVIEPVLIVLIAGVVLFIALAIFMPMWNMASLVK